MTSILFRRPGFRCGLVSAQSVLSLLVLLVVAGPATQAATIFGAPGAVGINGTATVPPYVNFPVLGDGTATLNLTKLAPGAGGFSQYILTFPVVDAPFHTGASLPTMDVNFSNGITSGDRIGHITLKLNEVAGSFLPGTGILENGGGFGPVAGLTGDWTVAESTTSLIRLVSPTLLNPGETLPTISFPISLPSGVDAGAFTLTATTAVPEPSTVAFLGLVCGGCGVFVRRRCRRQA